MLLAEVTVSAGPLAAVTLCAASGYVELGEGTNTTTGVRETVTRVAFMALTAAGARRGAATPVGQRVSVQLCSVSERLQGVTHKGGVRAGLAECQGAV